jgi:hypothetical protein
MYIHLHTSYLHTTHNPPRMRCVLSCLLMYTYVPVCMYVMYVVHVCMYNMYVYMCTCTYMYVYHLMYVCEASCMYTNVVDCLFTTHAPSPPKSIVLPHVQSLSIPRCFNYTHTYSTVTVSSHLPSPTQHFHLHVAIVGQQFSQMN